MRLDNLFEATPKTRKSAGHQQPGEGSSNFSFDDWEEKVGKDIRIDFPIRNCTFGNYMSSSLIFGTIEKIDRAKNRIIVKIEEMIFNDETIAGGPSGKVQNYKMGFQVQDMESTTLRGSTVEVVMNA